MAFLRKLLVGATALFALAAAAPVAKPSELTRRQDAGAISDIDILQFALTLEHLEAAFYKEGFEKFPAADFLALGLDERTIQGLIKIGETEATHVTVLSAAIQGAGVAPVQPCQYNFNVNSAAEMVQTAKILEAVGVAAYLGGAPLISDKAILAAAASIVTVEARHNTDIRNALKEPSVPQAFDISASVRQIFTLAAQFIVSCPAGSELNIQGFAPLVINNAVGVQAGNILQLRDTQIAAQQTLFCSFTSGEAGVQFSPVTAEGCAVPSGLTGEVFVTLGTSNTVVEDASIVAGPAILVLS